MSSDSTETTSASAPRLKMPGSGRPAQAGANHPLGIPPPPNTEGPGSGYREYAAGNSLVHLPRPSPRPLETGLSPPRNRL
ncbi:hypothetical protein L209DRAFT_749198 [Thermothelomyces heterothallicus CBS 203.75]